MSATAATGLTAAEWQVVEHLAEAHSLLSEIDGLDFKRFDDQIQGLQEMILALPAKRKLQRQESASKSLDAPNRQDIMD